MYHIISISPNMFGTMDQLVLSTWQLYKQIKQNNTFASKIIPTIFLIQYFIQKIITTKLTESQVAGCKTDFDLFLIFKRVQTDTQKFIFPNVQMSFGRLYLAIIATQCVESIKQYFFATKIHYFNFREHFNIIFSMYKQKRTNSAKFKFCPKMAKENEHIL